MEAIEITLCVDCTTVAANADWTGIDDPDREAEIRAGFNNAGGTVVVGQPNGYCTTPCDVCGTRLHGDHHTGAILL